MNGNLLVQTIAGGTIFHCSYKDEAGTKYSKVPRNIVGTNGSNRYSKIESSDSL